MTSLNRTATAEGTTRSTSYIAWLSGLIVLMATGGAIILGLTGHPAVAASVTALGCAGVAGGVHVTINIRR